MGSILISVPDFSDAQLVFDAGDTRDILNFFWPERAADLASVDVTNHVRRLAQTALVAAIEGSYAMGFIDKLLQSLRGAHNLSKWGRKLATSLVGHAWKHATTRDLRDVRIYESLRSSVALSLRHEVDMVLKGLAFRPGILHFYAHQSSKRPLVWA
jgi:hypothetical protein